MKKIILVLNLIATALILLFHNPVDVGLCEKNEYGCRNIFDSLENSCYIFALALFFSIVTYKAPERVFTAWWKFASFSVPVIFVGSIIVNLGYFHDEGGFLNMNDTIDQVLLGGMYLIFTSGSIIQIIRGYRQK